jgi:2-keto-4-pentenoate hydratase/2-oxohepta-3-ene-1,7-dioic acid hydratase in catechol pathway
MVEEEQQRKYDLTHDLDYFVYQSMEDDEFDEARSCPPKVRTKSNPGLKVDFCCLPANVIRCVCANIIAHIQSSENSRYVPPPDYDFFNKESGSLVSSSPYRY